jgi:hypothetical protein
MSKILFALGICSLLLSCTGNHTNDEKHPTDTSFKTTVQSEKTSGINEPVRVTDSVFQLLQGKWQHEEDTSNYLVFAGNKRREIAEGMTDWDEEEFILSNKCLNESDKDREHELEDFAYITCPKSDVCWYIMGVGEETLSLQYMARGNMLIYRRVK